MHRLSKLQGPDMEEWMWQFSCNHIKENKLEMWLSWAFRDMNGFIYMSQRLNLNSQSEKFQVKP